MLIPKPPATLASVGTPSPRALPTSWPWCELANVDPEQLLKFTYRIGDESTSKWVGDEWIAPKLMRFDAPSVCPSCIEDAQSGSSNFLGSGAPIWWYIDGIRSCPIHGRALIQLPRPERGRCKHDHAGRVRDNTSLIMKALKSGERRAPTEVELYVIRRLSCGRSKHRRWVDRLDIGTVIRASEQLGLVALEKNGRDQSKIDEQTLAAASSSGFSAISRGPKNLARELARLSPKRPRGGFYSDFFTISLCL